jgi:chromosome segregation ATPase
VVSDFTSLATGLQQDLSAAREPITQDVQEKEDRIKQTRSDLARREERISQLQHQISAGKDEIAFDVRRSDALAQQQADIVGAQIQSEYLARAHELKIVLTKRIKALDLKISDNGLETPENWLSAYRAALSRENIPTGLDRTKEKQWLDCQAEEWRKRRQKLDLLRNQMHARINDLRQSPAARVDELNLQIQDWQAQLNSMLSEEARLKEKLQQTLEDVQVTQADDAHIAGQYYKQLDSLPESSILNQGRIPIATDGRFTWVDDETFIDTDKPHHRCIFFRAIRADGEQYWAMRHFSLSQNQTLELLVEPTSFISTKSILQPYTPPATH